MLGTCLRTRACLPGSPAPAPPPAPTGSGESCAGTGCTPCARRPAAPTAGSASAGGRPHSSILGDVCTRRCGFCAVAKGVPGRARPGRGRAPGRRGGRTRPASTWWSPRSPGTICPTAAPPSSPGWWRRSRRATTALGGDPDPRLRRPRGVAGDHPGQPPRRLQPQRRDGPAPLPEGPPGGRLPRSLRLLSTRRGGRPGGQVGHHGGPGGGRTTRSGRCWRTCGGPAARCLTVGQYLRPTRGSLPVDRYPEPDWFAKWAEVGYRLGFKHVASAPLVRSSYRAGEGYRSAV